MRKCLSATVWAAFSISPVAFVGLIFCNLFTYLVQRYNIKFWGLSWTPPPLPTLISYIINGHSLTKKTFVRRHSFTSLNIYYNYLGQPNVALISQLTHGIYRNCILMNIYIIKADVCLSVCLWTLEC